MDLEEAELIKYIFKLDSYVFLFKPFNITNIANYLFTKYDALYINKKLHRKFY